MLLRLRVRQQALHWLTMAASAHRATEHFERALSSVDISARPQVQLVYPSTLSGSAAPVLPPGSSLAVLDSSFNPPTCAHVHMLHAVARRFGASHRLLLLAKNNADKPVVGASLPQRLQMMELMARADSDGATLCGVTAHPLFVDKASALRSLCGQDAHIYLLVGLDTWKRIVDPRYYAAGGRDAAMASLFRSVEVVVTSRDSVGSPPGAPPVDIAQQEARVLGSLPDAISAGRLHFMRNDQAMAALSSSEARGAFAANDMPAALGVIPDCIHAYLREHKLY
jgi:nicotinamide-nucleotide adenylyltransferase